jgi:hypothetical protein
MELSFSLSLPPIVGSLGVAKAHVIAILPRLWLPCIIQVLMVVIGKGDFFLGTSIGTTINIIPLLLIDMGEGTMWGKFGLTH